MTPTEVWAMPWRLWTAMALSVDEIVKRREEQAAAARRNERTRMAHARRRR